MAKDNPMDDQTILQQIDACRSGTDDAFDPSLGSLSQSLASDERVRELYERVQRADAAITDVIEDVPVPADLAQRLLASLQTAKLDDPVDLDASGPAVALERVDWLESGDAKEVARTEVAKNSKAAAKNEERAAVKTGRGRLIPLRRTYQAVAALAALAACFLVWMFYNPAPESVSPDQIALEIREIYDAEIRGASVEDWSTAVIPYPEFAVFDYLSPELRTPKRWRRIEVAGHMTIAHQLASENKNLSKRKTLFVIKRTVKGLGDQPPEYPLYTPHLRIGVWQSDHFVFALVVQGDDDDYRKALDESRGAVAQLRRKLDLFRETPLL